MNQTQFDSKEFFTVKELAEIFRRNAKAGYQTLYAAIKIDKVVPYLVLHPVEGKLTLLVAKNELAGLVEKFGKPHLAEPRGRKPGTKLVDGKVVALKRGPGRPKKLVAAPTVALKRGRKPGSKLIGGKVVAPGEATVQVAAPVEVKRGPGRPKGSLNKVPQVEAPQVQL